jgi:hypothetical protein
MLSSTLALKQRLFSQIEILPKSELQNVLNYVNSISPKKITSKTISFPSQSEILLKLKEIRENIQQTHGIYQGDLIAEVRAERHLPFGEI